ncbi:MAG: NAD-dependent DNA ligase LigA [Bacteroidota bacterium]
MYSKAQQQAFYKTSKDFLKTEVTIAKVEQLRDALKYHEWRYSILNDPVLSDFEYDQLFKKLEALEEANPSLITPDSPTQRVSNDLISEFLSVEHLTPMLSLANSYNAEDLKEWDEQVKKVANLPAEQDIEYIVEPKFDGGSIALVYENDYLTRGATRGNGRLGEEMTPNARAMPSIPLKATFSGKGFQKVELRGEVLIRKDLFKKVNEKRAAEGLSIFANPRNAATGGLRMKDPRESAKRQMDAFIYQLGYAIDENGENVLDRISSHEESIALLESLGFKVPRQNKERKVCKNIAEVVQFCLDWERKREQYEYEIDGMVVKVNSLDLQKQVGYTSHHPRWAIAFKFKAKQATSKLLNVEYQVGKIGSITPVAKIEPVPLAGVTVSSISLHNEEFINSKDLRLGDTVLVERAGDVIPYIVKSMEDLRDGSEIPIEFPSNCPVCATTLVKEESEAAWRCVNYECEAQVLQRMIHHISKVAMDIDGFGKSYIERFHELGWLKNLADIYRLDYEQIEQLEGFGKRSAEKLKKAIDKAKKNPIHRLLHSLSVHHLGKKASKLIAAEIEHVLDLRKWSEEDFTHIKDIGPIVAKNVITFFQEEKNIELLKEMESLGVNMNQTEEDRPKVVDANAPLVGKTILFTGSLQQMSRKAAQEKAEAAGARNVSAVSSKLNILVVGEKAGSKLKKAQALGTVEILTEEAFLELVA